ncbi:septum formation family protein [Pseudonocardia lacus]|uniref:septum formation family protein n=1 Tax=Pseudonocardia lacus TaxID=2835865 RepID=UPI001BDC7343|nr:septum formation family protein [Pseudonocardia lacus]
MDRTLTAPRRGLADAEAPPAGFPEIPPAFPRYPDDRAPRRPAGLLGGDHAAPAPLPKADRRAPARPRRGSSTQHPARRVVLGVLVGALTMLGVASLDTMGAGTVPVLGSFAALPAAPAVPEVIEVEPPPATPGTCLNWSRADAADTALVDCAQSHLFEQAGSVALTDQVVLPDDQKMRQLVNERCTPVVVDYLGGKFDPVGRYRVGALKPSAAKWEQGNRDLRCGLQSASRSGALYPMVGKASEGDQANVQEPGTCLAIDGKTIGDPVSCSGRHAVETVGIVDLSGQFPDAFPQVGDQDGFLQPECARIAGEYVGDPAAIAAKGLTVYWDNLTEESWNAGTRRVNCNLAALLPDRSGFAPITGAAKGTVVVGGEPAAPSANTPAPGVPAPPVAPVDEPDGQDGTEQPPLDGQNPPADGDQPDGEQPPADGEQPPADGEAPPTTEVPTTQAPPAGGDIEVPIVEQPLEIPEG